MSVREVEDAARALYVPFVYGSISFWLGRKGGGSSAEHSHKWTVFVRGANNRDITYGVAKVVFTLHSSFQNHIREVTEPPFEVSETGWGEFEIGIKICPRDPAAEPISLTHMLKLYSQGPASTERPVLSEVYDEMVYNELPADAAAAEALRAGPGPDPPPYPYQEWLTAFDAENDLAVIQAARQVVSDRKVELQDRLLRAEAERAALLKDLAALGAL